MNKNIERWKLEDIEEAMQACIKAWSVIKGCTDNPTGLKIEGLTDDDINDILQSQKGLKMASSLLIDMMIDALSGEKTPALHKPN